MRPSLLLLSVLSALSACGGYYSPRYGGYGTYGNQAGYYAPSYGYSVAATPGQAYYNGGYYGGVYYRPGYYTHSAPFLSVQPAPVQYGGGMMMQPGYGAAVTAQPGWAQPPRPLAPAGISGTVVVEPARIEGTLTLQPGSVGGTVTVQPGH